MRCSSFLRSVFTGSQSRAARRAAVVACLFVGGLVLGAAGCERHEAGPTVGTGPPTEVTVLTVAPSDVPVTFEYIAQVQSSRQVNIQARVNGFLDKRVYTEGAIVKAGQVLFQMDQKPFQAQLDQARRRLQGKKQRLEVARLNLARVKPLAAANALSQKDLDDATGQFQSAAAAVEQAKADVETAKLNLSYTTITSPVDRHHQRRAADRTAPISTPPTASSPPWRCSRRCG